MIVVAKENISEQELIAEEFGLRYLSEKNSGFTRIKKGENFEYFDTKLKPISDSKVLHRIKSLVIPPAWQEVWISPFSNSHIQATGLDARGRKQYIYHKEWIKYRCETKFDKMEAFGEALPLIRKQVEKDLARKSLDKKKVLSAVVGLLDHTLIRIGNKRFELDNQSYGLTTLRDKHMKAIGKTVIFEFSGKRGIKQELEVTDMQLAKIVKKCRDIPGHKLFQYYNKEGKKFAITSEDVNEYLKNITKRDITSKDFRTWGASTYAVKRLLNIVPPRTKNEIKKNLATVIKEVARKLGNTETVCRKYYLHPIVLKAYSDHYISKIISEDTKYHLKGSKLLSPPEKLFLLILEKLR